MLFNYYAIPVPLVTPSILDLCVNLHLFFCVPAF